MPGSVTSLLVLAILLSLPGCYRHAYTVSGFSAQEEAARSPWRHHLFFGAVSLSSDLDLRNACPQGVARVENEMGPLNVIVAIVTVGIYTPTTTEIYCRHLGEDPTPMPPNADAPAD